MQQITMLAGQDKQAQPESFQSLQFNIGDMVAIVGNTGSGKSRFIMDIEQLVQGDSVSKRTVLIDGKLVARQHREAFALSGIAHLSQNMRFVLDTNVSEFLSMHINCRQTKSITPMQVISLANEVTKEPITLAQNLNVLSGGQTRALMIADIALVCQSPIVLIDEIENAGVDKKRALNVLVSSGKIVLVVTHDPHVALMCGKRIQLENGAVKSIRTRTKAEENILLELDKTYERHSSLQNYLRQGVDLV